LKSENIFCVADLPSMTHTALGAEEQKEGKKERNKQRKKESIS